MEFCNIMTCGGLGYEFLGGCSMAWIAAVILFFLIVFARSWLAEALDMPFSSVGAFALGYIAFLATLTVSCSHKFALGAGILGAAAGAYFGGLFENGGLSFG